MHQNNADGNLVDAGGSQVLLWYHYCERWTPQLRFMVQCLLQIWSVSIVLSGKALTRTHTAGLAAVIQGGDTGNTLHLLLSNYSE